MIFCLWLHIQFFHASNVAMGYDVSVYIKQQSHNFFYGLSTTDWCKAVERPCGDHRVSQPNIEIARILYEPI